MFRTIQTIQPARLNLHQQKSQAGSILLKIQKATSIMADSKLKAAVLVVSDTASRDPSTDKVGGILAEAFAQEGGRWGNPTVSIVPDDVQAIQRQIREWTDSDTYFNAIITSGGTGFSVKDNTPEVI